MTPVTPPSAADGCPRRQTLVEFTLGRLPDAELVTVADHLSGCPRCLADLTEIQREAAEGGLDARLRRCVAAANPTADTLSVPGTAASSDVRDATPSPAADRGRLVGKSVGPYTLLEEIGAGGMGVVYRAEQLPVRQRVALKMILGPGELRPDRLSRFRTEGEAIARLQHPNVVRLYHFDEYEGLPYYTMELVEGGNLARKLAAGPVDFREAAELVRTLAVAVEYFHQRQVVHRDLKPGNVLLTIDGVPKVTDFGLAKLLDADGTGATLSDAILGTPNYMAPEQAAGRVADVGPPSDVYALGAILYECLAGRPPFQGEKLSVLEQARTVPPTKPSAVRPGVPDELEAVCLQCLEKDPARRYASAQALADDLGRWLNGEPTVVRPPGWAARHRRGLRRSAAVLVVILLAVAGLIIADRLDPERPWRQIKADLDRGHKVKLIGETGPPKYFRIRSGDEQTTTHTAPDDGTFTVGSWGRMALIELVPDSRHARYKFRVSVWHRQGDIPGKVGVYVARREFPGPTRPTHLFAGMVYNDIRTMADAPHPPNVKVGRGNSVGLGPGIAGEQVRGVNWELWPQTVRGPLFEPRGITGDRWRDLELLVTPEGVSGVWDGQPVGHVPSRDMTAEFGSQLRAVLGKHPTNPFLAGIDSTYSARGGVGLFVLAGSASFHSAVLTPVGD